MSYPGYCPSNNWKIEQLRLEKDRLDIPVILSSIISIILAIGFFITLGVASHLIILLCVLGGFLFTSVVSFICFSIKQTRLCNAIRNLDFFDALDWLNNLTPDQQKEYWQEQKDKYGWRIPYILDCGAD